MRKTITCMLHNLIDMSALALNMISIALRMLLYLGVFLQPVGFVTFHTRAGAEAAKQDLQVGIVTIKFHSIEINQQSYITKH